MPFDPNLPPNNVQVKAAELRGQFNGLKELIDALQSVTGAQVDSVTTLDPGQSATASIFVNGQTLHFSFGIPRGADGVPGTPGSVINGAQVDSVSSVGSVDPASASASYDGSILHFTFGIPRGIDGVNGAPGEVTNAALDAAIGGTSSNSNGVGTLDTPFADPDDEALRGKVNELIAALRRL
jgi:hypothetical protein